MATFLSLSLLHTLSPSLSGILVTYTVFPSFLDLPREIHRIVLQDLSNEHRPSLWAFASASQTCHTLARPNLYETVKVNAKDSQELHDLVETIVQAFQRNSSFQYVRRIVVGGNSMAMDRNQQEGEGREDPQALDRVRALVNDLHECLDRYKGVSGMHVWHTRIEDSPPNDAWQPLADLIQRLPSLLDLIFLCPFQFPSCLLEVLHR